MTPLKLQSEYWLPVNLKEVWSFHKDLKNYEKLDSLNLTQEIHSDSSLVKKGLEFSLKFKNGFPFLPQKLSNWNGVVTYVEESDQRCSFVDELKSGPLALWKHEHIFFRACSELELSSGHKAKPKMAGTWVIDKVELSLFDSKSLLNSLFCGLDQKVAKKFMTKFLSDRQMKVKELLKSC